MAVTPERRSGAESTGVLPVGARWLLILAVALITLLALAVRLRDLASLDVSLTIDEARLVLVSRGLLDDGWPVLPSGKVYTRGLPVAITIVPSLAMFGDTDLAARLPSVLAGVLLVPVMALYAGRVAGWPAALIASMLVALYPPLVIWSRQAWFFAHFVLFWMLVLFCLDRALMSRSSLPLVVASLVTVLGMLTHELFVTLLSAWGFVLLVLVRDRVRFKPMLPGLLTALAALILGLGLLAAFTLTHRADTLAGRFGEVTEYATLNTDLAGFRFYGRMLVDRYWLLFLAALVGLVLSPHRQRLLLLLAIVPLFIVDAFVLPGRPQERYGLALVPPLFVLAAAGLQDINLRLRASRPGQLSTIVGAVLLVVVPIIHLDLAGLIRRTDVSGDSGTWLGDLRGMGYAPGDLVLTDIPTVTQVYLGHTDGWLVSQEYQKYAYQPDAQLREIHTGAPLIRSVAELDRFLAQAPAGRGVWVVASGRSYQWQEIVDRALRRSIEDRATARVQSLDTTRVYRLAP